MSGERAAYREDVVPGALGGKVQALLGVGWRLALVAGHDDGDGFRVVYSFLRPVGQRETRERIGGSDRDGEGGVARRRDGHRGEGRGGG